MPGGKAGRGRGAPDTKSFSVMGTLLGTCMQALTCNLYVNVKKKIVLNFNVSGYILFAFFFY